MRNFSMLILTIMLTSCMGCSIGFEKEFYEKVSHIKFPKKYKVLESFDNGEWLTGTVLAIDNAPLKKIIAENGFDTLRKMSDLHFLSNSYLTRHKAEFRTVHNIFFISKSENRNNWTYVVDLNDNRLWAEISYPDWSGN